MHPQLHASVSAWMNKSECVWNWASKWTASKVRLDWLAASITSSLCGFCWIMLSVNNEFQKENVCHFFNVILQPVWQISLHMCLIFSHKVFLKMSFVSINHVTIHTFIAGVCSFCWFLCIFLCASIAFFIAIQWKCENLLSQKQPKFSETNSPLSRSVSAYSSICGAHEICCHGTVMWTYSTTSFLEILCDNYWQFLWIFWKLSDVFTYQ